MGLILGGVSPQDLILDGQPVSLWVGGNPPVKVWPTVVQITLGTGMQARDQFRAALADFGLNYQTVEEVPFEIEMVGSGSAQHLFEGCFALTSVPNLDTRNVTNMNNMFAYCTALTSVPAMNTSNVTNMSSMFDTCSALTHAPTMDTSNVTDMNGMFSGCGALTHVPDMDTSQVTNMDYMFFVCTSLTDGNVRLIGKHPNVSTDSMISVSGLTREPWYNADGTPRETVQITTNNRNAARDQFRAVLADRGLDYRTVTEIPFDIELVGGGTSTRYMFDGCSALTTVPAMDTSGVTDMQYMFNGCSSLTKVPDLITDEVSTLQYMFQNCEALTDGNVRLLGKKPQFITTTNMIRYSGLTYEPWHTVGDPADGVYEVTLTGSGSNTAHPLVSAIPRPGETWNVRIQGTVTNAGYNESQHPRFRIGTVHTGTYAPGESVDFSGTITAANNAIAMLSDAWVSMSFTGTVTIQT